MSQPAHYHDELEAELMLEEAKEPDIDAIEENQFEQLVDYLSPLPEKVVIEGTLSFLDQHGYNLHVLGGIRSLLRQPKARRKNG